MGGGGGWRIYAFPAIFGSSARMEITNRKILGGPKNTVESVEDPKGGRRSRREWWEGRRKQERHFPASGAGDSMFDRAWVVREFRSPQQGWVGSNCTPRCARHTFMASSSVAIWARATSFVFFCYCNHGRPKSMSTMMGRGTGP